MEQLSVKPALPILIMGWLLLSAPAVMATEAVPVQAENGTPAAPSTTDETVPATTATEPRQEAAVPGAGSDVTETGMEQTPPAAADDGPELTDTETTAPETGTPDRKPGGRILRFEYGPVRGGETLGSIARSVYIAEDVDHFQVMWAIFQNNPDAFVNGNINRLRTGVLLNIPSRETIAATDSATARKEILARHRQWQRRNEQAQAARIKAAREKAERMKQENRELNQRLSDTEDKLQRLLKENQILNQELEKIYNKEKQ